MAGRYVGSDDLRDEEDCSGEQRFWQTRSSGKVAPTSSNSPIVPVANMSTTVAVELQVPQQSENSSFSLMQQLPIGVSQSLDHVSGFLNPVAAVDVSALQAIEGFTENWGDTGKTPVDTTPWIFGSGSPGHDHSTASDARNLAWRIGREDSLSSYSSDSSEHFQSSFQGIAQSPSQFLILIPRLVDSISPDNKH
ncbi:unnamed protein product [Calypogeia fissa]